MVIIISCYYYDVVVVGLIGCLPEWRKQESETLRDYNSRLETKVEDLPSMIQFLYTGKNVIIVINNQHDSHDADLHILHQHCDPDYVQVISTSTSIIDSYYPLDQTLQFIEQ